MPTKTKTATKPTLTILALDPGTNNFGASVLDVFVTGKKVRVKVLKHGLILSTIRTLTTPSVFGRERAMFEKELDSLIREHRVTHIIAERYMLRRGAGGSTIESVNLMLGLIHARNLPTRIIPASQWKNHVTRLERDLDAVYAEVKPYKITPHQCDAVHIGHYGVWELTQHLGTPKSLALADVKAIIRAPAFRLGESTKIKKKKVKRKRTVNRKS